MLRPAGRNRALQPSHRWADGWAQWLGALTVTTLGVWQWAAGAFPGFVERQMLFLEAVVVV